MLHHTFKQQESFCENLLIFQTRCTVLRKLRKSILVVSKTLGHEVVKYLKNVTSASGLEFPSSFSACVLTFK